MKKIFCFLGVFITLLACTAGVGSAHAEGIYDDLKAMAKEQKFVKEVSVLTFSNYALIALRCDSIYFQDDKNILKSEIIKKVKAKYPDFTKVYVKLDMDIFLKTRNIEKKMSGGATYFDLKNELAEVLALCEKRE